MSLGFTIVTIGTIHFSNGSKDTNMTLKDGHSEDCGTPKGL